MDTTPRDSLSIQIERLRAEQARQELELRDLEEKAGGARDVEATLALAEARFALCLALMKRIAARSADTEELQNEVSQCALSAVRLVEGLLTETISEDQRGIIQAHPAYARFRSRMEEFVLAGGIGFLQPPQANARKKRALARAVSSAIRRLVAVDDMTPALDIEDYPPFVRKVLLALFPVMIKEHPEKPPYGINEGEEILSSSQKMKLPLSQAIFYMENELLPELEAKLAQDPGSADLQEEIGRLRDRLDEYKKLRFFPRSTPVLLENGYYSEAMTSYTTDGEMLVPIPLAVSIRSGTNLDRMMEMVRMDVVRRIAGKGVSPALDAEYRRLRSISSGPRGNSRITSMKIDTAWGYRVLKQEFPLLARLSDKKGFQELVKIAKSKSGEARIEALIGESQSRESLASLALGSARDPA